MAVLRDDLVSLQRVARELVEDAGDNGVRYVEVGLEPAKFLREGGQVTEEEVVRAVLR